MAEPVDLENPSNPMDPVDGVARKVRRHLLPMLFLLYVVAYLDRINVGFAALNMNRELGLSSEQYGLLSGIFFCGYFLFEIPSNLILHRTGARTWIARILLTWGVVACVTVVALIQVFVSRSVNQSLAAAGLVKPLVTHGQWWRLVSASYLSSDAGSGSPSPLRWPSRSLPSRSVQQRSARAAASASWVTSTTAASRSCAI